MAFVDFLEPTPPAGTPLGGDASPYRGRLTYKESGGEGTLGGGERRFELRKSMAPRPESPVVCRGQSPASRPPVAPGSPEISVHHLERRFSLSTQNSNSGSTIRKLSPGTAGSPSASPRPMPSPTTASISSSPAGSPCGSPGNSLRGPLKAVKGPEVKLQSTFERNMPRSGFSDAGSDSDSSEENCELLGASAPEDEANDAALGAFLAASNDAARTRRERAADEMLPWSQQLLSQQATRRSRRMSSDSGVCETRPWVDALQGTDPKAKRNAAKSIRMALKDGPENRMRLVGSGGVRPLVLALKCSDCETVEHAAAAILFLCMSRDTSPEVLCNGGVRMLIDVVADRDPLKEPGRSNAAASLFALSQKEEQRKLVHSQGAVRPLVSLLKDSKTSRAKKDSCLALYNLSMVPQAPKEMVELGVVERSVELLEEAEEGVEEKAAALLGCLAKSEAGLMAILDEEDSLYALADTLEGGSTAAAEHAAVALHRMVVAKPKLVQKVLAEGCLPPLVRLASQSKKGSDSRMLLDIVRSYCKRKAKEEESRRADVSSRPLSRLGLSSSFSGDSGSAPLGGDVGSSGFSSSFTGRLGSPCLVDRECLLKAFSSKGPATS